MKFNIPRIIFISLISLYGCAGFFNDLLDHDTVIVSFKIEKSKNPSLTQDCEGYIDTYGKRVIVDFKQASVSASVLRNLIPTITTTAREIYPDTTSTIDLNGTVVYTLKTLRKSSEWKISSCCLNTGIGPTLLYTGDWEHTLADPTADVAFGDGIVKKSASIGSESLFLGAIRNGTPGGPTHIEKVDLGTGTTLLSASPLYAGNAFADVWQTPLVVISFIDTNTSTAYVRKINWNTLSTTLEATFTSAPNKFDLVTLPNSGGLRIKGLQGVSPGDLKTFNIYDPTGEQVTFKCGTGTTETSPFLAAADPARETYYVAGTSLNCGSVSSGTDIVLARIDNNFNILWKRTIWSAENDLLPQIGVKRTLTVLSDGSVIVSRFWVSGAVQNQYVKYDLNGNDLTSTTNFPGYASYLSASNIVLITTTNHNDDLFYASYNSVTGAYSIQRSDTNGNQRPITFSPTFSVGCNVGQQTISVSVDASYNLYFNCLKTNTTTGFKEMYVKKFKATVIQ